MVYILFVVVFLFFFWPEDGRLFSTFHARCSSCLEFVCLCVLWVLNTQPHVCVNAGCPLHAWERVRTLLYSSCWNKPHTLALVLNWFGLCDTRLKKLHRLRRENSAEWHMIKMSSSWRTCRSFSSFWTELVEPILHKSLFWSKENRPARQQK